MAIAYSVFALFTICLMVSAIWGKIFDMTWRTIFLAAIAGCLYLTIFLGLLYLGVYLFTE